MNLTSRRARTLLALCSIGAVVGAGVTATSAFAAGQTITFSPTATSATITNIDPTGSAAIANAALAYGTKIVPTSSDVHPLRVDALTGPGPLYVERASGNGVPAANPTGAAHSRSITDGFTFGKRVTLAAAGFRAADVGATITGTDIPAGTTIASVNSATSVELSAATTASGTGRTFTINPPARTLTDVGTTSASLTLTSATGGFVDAAASAGGDIGAFVTGPGIPVGATIAAVGSATSVTLSAVATVTNTGVTVTVDPPLVARAAAAGVTSGKTVTGTTFTDADLGFPISGTGIPAGATIASQTGGTSAELSVATTATTPTGTNVTLGIGASHAATDGATAAKTVTATDGNFRAADVGAAISGTGIPASATIASVTSTTSVELSAATTATATGLALTVDPAARTVTDGAITSGSTALTSVTAAFSNSTAALGGDQTAVVSGTGIPAGTTIVSVSGNVATLSAAATATATGVTVTVDPPSASRSATTAGTTAAMTVTTGTSFFVATDVGLAITGTGIPAGATIVSRTATTAVLSVATTATGTGLTVTVAGAAATGTGIGTVGVATLAVAAGGGSLAGHIIKIAKSGETTEIVKVVDGTTTLNLDRPLAAAHSAAAITDLGLATGINPFTTVGPATSAQVYNYVDADNLYFGAVVPGTYTFRLYKDHNSNGSYDSASDDATSTFTLTVKDVNGTTTTTSDDLSPTLTVAATAGVGETVTATVNTGLTTTDTRGLNGATPNVDVLGFNIAAASTLAFDGTYLSGGTTSFDGTSVSKTSAAAVAGTGTTTYSIGSLPVTRTSSTVVANNTAATIDEDVTNVVGSVKDATGTAARAVHVKDTVAQVTYTATVKNSTPVVVSGVTVRFTLTTGTNTPVLTADGTLVSSTSTTKVYSALTDSTGIATLRVTSATTTAGTTYTVAMATNGVSGSSLSTAYEAVAATTLENTNTDSSLLVTPGTSAVLTGRLLDQFDAAYAPSGSDSAQVAVRIPAGGTTVGNAVIASGAFSYTYAPTTTPTAGTQTTWDFYYVTTTLNGTDSAINWASTEAASSVTIAAPVAAATPTQKTAIATPGAGTTVTGSVLNASSAGLAYKTVTLTGTAGVYFSNVATPTTATTDNLATSVTLASNGSGIYTGYAFFTKAGAATITATSGTATQTVNVVVTQASDPYTVTAAASAVEPGGTSVVTGTVLNGFGHPVSGATVNLGLGASTAVTLGATSVTTNSDGVYSTTLTAASGGSGTATLTATLNAQTANATAHADWLANAGLTIAAGVYQATATVTIDSTINATTITGPTSRVGAGNVALSGTAKTSTAVEIYGKAAGTSAAYALVGMVVSGTDGAWSSTQYISTTTSFFAKTSVSTSAAITVTVTPVVAPHPVLRSTVSLRATALGKGKVRLAANGGPTGRGVLRFYRWSGRSWVSLAAVRGNAAGDATVMVKSPRGTITFRAVYTAPGRTAAGANARIRVR